MDRPYDNRSHDRTPSSSRRRQLALVRRQHDTQREQNASFAQVGMQHREFVDLRSVASSTESPSEDVDESSLDDAHSSSHATQMAPALWSPSTVEHDLITHCVSKFNQYNYQLCAWTSLLTLPRRSTIPSILSGHYRRGYAKKTNWATFYLPHLSLGNADDPLALSISAFTALQMKYNRSATRLYLSTLSQLRKILARKNVAAMSNMEFLRIWATTLLLTEYENQEANQESQYQHLAGATTLSKIARSRFPEYLEPTLDTLPVENTVAGTVPVMGETHTISRTERELPQYLMALTQRLNHSKAIRESRDTVWPTSRTSADREGLGALLDKSSECYRLLMPVLHHFYYQMAAHPPKSQDEHVKMLEFFAPQVTAIQEALSEYKTMLSSLHGTAKEIFQSCASSKFPFSPILKFINPIMCGPVTFPHIAKMFLAPFISEKEHYESIRFISGVFAGFESNPGLLLDAAFPDIHVAAFWRQGPERDYFIPEVERRGGDFKVLLTKIWGAIDGLEQMHGTTLSPTVKLGISLKAYSEAQKAGLKLKNTRH